VCSLFEQTALKADGVAGYLSFAAGTYRMSAYGVLGNAKANTQSRFDFADTTFSFDDGKVYTLIAYGNGAFSASTVGTGNSVKLALIQESVAPTDFGFASVRFFHAIERASAVSLNIANGGTQLFNGIGFGSVSDYTSIRATKSVHFSVSRSDTPNKDETDVTQTHDLRAGLRATLICAVNNLDTPAVFCRMIPSRVVAYVRLVHDAADKQQLVQGRFGPQKLSETKLTLWASFEYPRPSDTVAWSQDMGQVVTTGHPLTTRGLYPVVTNVAANQVSGYGEVFVPLFIMDFAVRFVVGFSGAGYTTATSAMNDNANRGVSGASTVVDDWFYYAPIFKRVNFVLKTEGYTTLVGDTGATGLTFPGVTAGGNTYHAGSFTPGTNNIATALLTDIYMEPGEFYTIFATGNNRATHLTKLQSDGMVRLEIRKDLTVDDVHSDFVSTSGSVVFVPFAMSGANSQAFAAINIAGQGAGSTTQARTWNNNAKAVNSAVISTWLATGWPTTERALQLTPGAYTYNQATTGTTCYNNLPSGTFSVEAGQRLEIFVLNTEGCVSNSNSLSQLVTVKTNFQSATASGHAPASNTATRAVRTDIPLYNAASAQSASLALLIAAVMAALALLAC
jgi:hypothetical protein